LFNIFAYDLAWAAVRPSASSTVGADRPGGLGLSFKPLTPDTFELPNNLGEAKIFEAKKPRRLNLDDNQNSTYAVDTGSEHPIVINIQDAHTDYSCQKAIQGIAEYLSSEYGVSVALLEGGAGKYDLSPFTDIEDKALRERVADYFVREGRLNGIELFAVLNPEKVTLRGLEDPDLYIKNLTSYREILKAKPKRDKILSDAEEELENLKDRIYSSELKRLDNRRIDFADNRVKLGKYVEFLVKMSRDSLHPTTTGDSLPPDSILLEKQAVPTERVSPFGSAFENLSKFTKVIELEKDINYRKANSERKRLIKKLGKRLSSLEEDELVNNSVHFKEGELAEDEFYSYLLRKASSVGINAQDQYPNLFKYKAYLKLYETIDNWELFKEIDSFEDELFNSLARNEDQKKLYRLSKYVALTGKLFNLSITRDEYDR